MGEPLLEHLIQNLNLPGYEMKKKIGEGTSGVVYRARQSRLDRPVAIKVLRPSLTDDPSYVKRFHQEIRTVGNLNHPSIVQAYDVGEQDGMHYYVMEYIDGKTLADLIEEEGRISPDRTHTIGLQISRALAHASESGLIHRDIKPENIMIADDGSVKLCDLGLARKRDGDESTDTSQSVLGTPYYMAPEQAQNEELDIRTDIYSLGATIYHAVTGRVPYEGDNVRAILKKHRAGNLTPPRELNPNLSSSLSQLIEKMMAPDPEDRPQSAEQLQESFENLRDGRRKKVKRRSRTVRSGSRRSRKFSNITLVFLLLLGLGLAGGIYFVVFQNKEGQSQTNETSVTTSETDKGTTENAERTGEKGSGSEPSEKETTEKSVQKRFEELKLEAGNIDGTPERVRQLVSRLDALKKHMKDNGLRQEVESFRHSFLNEQARKNLNRHMKELPDASLQQLVKTHQLLVDPPDVFSGTSVWQNDVNEKKQQVRHRIEDRLREMNERQRRKILHRLPEDQAQLVRGLVPEDDQEEQEEKGEGTGTESDVSLPLTLKANEASLDGAVLSKGKVLVRGSKQAHLEWSFPIESKNPVPIRLTFHYLLEGNQKAQVRCLVNGREIVNGTLNPTGGSDNWGTASTDATVASGENTLALVVNGIEGFQLNQVRLHRPDDNEEMDQSISASTASGKGSDNEDLAYEGPLEFIDATVGSVATAINFGGGQTRVEDIQFRADPFSGDDKNARTGRPTQVAGSVKPASARQVYGKQRAGTDMTFVLPLANGRYTIRLYFIETWFSHENGRRFHVSLQGKRVLNNFDIYREAGAKNKGITKTFTDIPVTERKLVLRLKGQVKAGIKDHAIIAGLAIRRTN